MDNQTIVIRGAREHNLRNVNLDLPRNKLIVFTGVSGSGKSSLAFDTLYAEGQRRYVESLSSYARQFLGQLQKPDVDYLGGLSPAISIQQKTAGRNPRSTVGTITEVYDYLRVLYARVGQGHCPQCGRPITAQTREQMLSPLQWIRNLRRHALRVQAESQHVDGWLQQLRTRASHERSDHAVCRHEIPVTIDCKRGVRLMTLEYEVDRFACGLQRRIVERARCKHGCETCGDQQLVALAQRHIEQFSESHDHVAARLRASCLDEAQVTRRDFGFCREVELTHASSLAPFAQQLADGAGGSRCGRCHHAATISRD